jgi:dethiobiotin synthetase
MRHQIFSLGGTAQADGCLPVATARLHAAKRAFATRRIDLDLAAGLIVEGAAPRPGDLVLAEVICIGQHKRIERVDGRRATLFEGDEILVVYGDRYAPDQFEALVPADLGPCDMVAAGGIAAQVTRKSDKVRAATRIAPIGLVVDTSGRRLSALDFGISEDPAATRPPAIAVLGSSMNAGKTTTMAALIHGETRAGRRVGAIKVTGTGSGGDLWSFLDAGAAAALDFTDAGHATTHRLTPEALERILATLMARMAVLGMDIVLVEIADGLLFPDTATLAVSDTFRAVVDGVVFAAADPMGALAGEAWLRDRGLPLRALAGAMTASPISAAEVAAQTRTPVLTLAQMQGGAVLASDLLA